MNENLEEKVKKLWEEINTGHTYSIIDSYDQFYGICLDIAEWQKEQDKETIEVAEDHAMFAGMEKMREQILNNIVEGEVVGIKKDLFGNSYGYVQLEGNYKEGDKIIILKE